MKDRLVELKNKLSENGHAVDSTEVSFVNSNEHLSSFFAEIESIQDQLTEIEFLNARLVQVHRSILNTPHPEPLLRKDAADIENQIRQKVVKTKLQISELNIKLPNHRSTVHTRMLIVQETALRRRLHAALNFLSAEQVRYREISKDRLKIQLKITRDSLLSEGVEDEAIRLLDLEDQQKTISVFTDDIEYKTLEAQQELVELQERHKELLTLENSIREVHDLFVDISMLVESQGELVDSIENNVTQAGDKVTSGQKELKQAEVNKEKSRKKKVLLIICCSCTIVILFLIIFIYFFVL